LIASGHVTAEMAHQNLTQAIAPLDAILFHLLLTSLTPIEVAQEVENVIQGSRDVTKLRSIALAAFSAMLFQSTESKVLARSRSTLDHVSMRLRQLGIPSQQDPYLFQILRQAGVS
jgi:hypothetical protein